MKTQDAIRARFDAVADADMFGFRRDVLATSLDWEHARGLVKDGVTEESWLEGAVLTEEAILEEARKYLDFAVGKVLDHRGISASRSVDKLAEYAWLLDHDEVASRMRDPSNYPQYGAPALVIFADVIDHHPDEMSGEMFRRMASGQSCRRGCADGCVWGE